MNKTKNMVRVGLVSAGTLLAFLFIGSASMKTAHAAIISQLSVGSTGAQVSELQQFLASNPRIYPAGTVSGFYGTLTQNAVEQFQATYGIDQVGNVGPVTQAKINNIMASGFGLDTSAPVMGNASVQASRTTATVNWATNELARGQVFYDTAPIRTDETTGPFQLAFVGGVAASINANGDVRNSESVGLQGLQPNTLYYYATRAIDNSGNVTMTFGNTFRTTP